MYTSVLARLLGGEAMCGVGIEEGMDKALELWCRVQGPGCQINAFPQVATILVVPSSIVEVYPRLRHLQYHPHLIHPEWHVSARRT